MNQQACLHQCLIKITPGGKRHRRCRTPGSIRTSRGEGEQKETQAGRPEITSDRARRADQDNCFGAGGVKPGNATVAPGARTCRRRPYIVCHASDLHTQHWGGGVKYGAGATKGSLELPSSWKPQKTFKADLQG